MNNKTINWREELINLFPDATTRTKEDTNEWCPKCKGVGLINEGNYVVGCRVCSGKGFIENCKCGNKIDHYGYSLCSVCRQKEWDEKCKAQDKERFEKASQINFDDYEGLFLWNDRAINKEDLEDELYSLIYDGEEPPTYIWATKKEKVFTDIDLKEIIGDKCEDGYEDMDSNFDYKDEDFIKAQELLNCWLGKHDSVTDVYYEDYRTVVLLDKVIEDIRKQNL